MPGIKEILHDESMNDGTFIQMYPEGVFYKAYETSAWLSCMHLGNLIVKKKHVKKANLDIVSVGFPKTALEKWANGRKTDISKDRVIKTVTQLFVRNLCDGARQKRKQRGKSGYDGST